MKRLIEGPLFPTVSLVEIGQVDRVIDEDVDPFRRPFECVDMKFASDVVQQDAALALVPDGPVKFFGMDGAMNVVHLVADVLHDVDLAGVRPRVAVVVTLPVLVVSASSGIREGAARQHPDCRPGALPPWQPGADFNPAIQDVGFAGRLQPCRGIKRALVVFTIRFDNEMAVFNTDVSRA